MEKAQLWGHEILATGTQEGNVCLDLLLVPVRGLVPGRPVCLVPLPYVHMPSAGSTSDFFRKCF